MNNQEESLLAPAANVQVSTTGHKLPEQAKFPVSSVPRPMTLLNLIYQWQPMGIRVIIDLPFTSDNKNFLFCIRNGPFIPEFFLNVSANKDENPFSPTGDIDVSNVGVFHYNNTRPVIHGPNTFTKFPEKNFIFITHYDHPPILASMSKCFRRWRGDMQYRIRTIAGFTTQGYIFAAPIKNSYSPIGIYDENVWSPPLLRQDSSYREAMMNSYVMGDTSMFRHLELTVPYEYPVSYYDQYEWLSRRYNPNKYNVNAESVMGRYISFEPHGDNWIVLGLRGNLAAAHEGAQIMFELEYRACEGFQFADPALPYQFMFEPLSLNRSDQLEKIIPNSKLESDGIGKIKVKGTQEYIVGEPPPSLMTRAVTMIKETISSTPKPVDPLTILVPSVTVNSPQSLKEMDRAYRIRKRLDPSLNWPDFYRRNYDKPKERWTRDIHEEIETLSLEEESEDREKRSLGRREREFSY